VGGLGLKKKRQVEKRKREKVKEERTAAEKNATGGASAQVRVEKVLSAFLRKRG